MSVGPGSTGSFARRVVIAHLFPNQLNLYGDQGNIQCLVSRATWRGIETEVRRIGPHDADGLRGADVIVIGGGADRQQLGVAEALLTLREPIAAALDEGAALLAVCAGFQLLGHAYRSPLVGEVAGLGLLDVETGVPVDGERLVGGLVVELEPGSPIAAMGAASAQAAGPGDGHRRLVGFENHGGRTTLGPSMRSLGRPVVGRGNDGSGAAEGVVALPGEAGVRGLRVGTYLHGPLLPRNPHLADFVLACGIGRGDPVALPALDDGPEWRAHAAFEADWRARRPGVSRRTPVGRTADRLASLIGF